MNYFGDCFNMMNDLARVKYATLKWIPARKEKEANDCLTRANV